MQRVVTLYQSTVGKKVMMAVSGVVLFGFVLAHMIGNLKMLGGMGSDGVAAMDTYAEFLRDFGYPLLPHEGLLWIARLVLLGAVLVHIVAAVQLTQRSRAARGGSPYKKQASLSFSYASRTMRWGGVILALFIIYHILHFTTGQAYGALEGAAFVKGEVYRNYVRLRTNYDPRTPAESLGFTHRPFTAQEVLSWRQDWGRESLHPTCSPELTIARAQAILAATT